MSEKTTRIHTYLHLCKKDHTGRHFFFDRNVTRLWAHVSELIFHADSENRVHFALAHQVLSLQIYTCYS